jgi:phosphoserine phosphatase
MALLEGLAKRYYKVSWKFTITKGAHRLMKALKYYGYKRYFIGGFTFLVNT